jgi:NtrC-family two-component system response regulator AlgB
MAVSCDTPVADELDAALFGAGVPGVASPFRSTGPVGPPGRAELCEGGTLCLEDVAQSPPSLQPKLHRFIREKEYERHNDFRSQRANVRVIGTSCVDPDEAVRRHRLRPELLLAFDVVRIEIPPLRSRPEDIRMLAQRYLTFFAKQNHRSIARFSSNAIAAMKKYPWPGNNRELRNLIERAVILCTSDEVGLEHFPPNLLNASAAVGLGDLVPLDQIEDLHIQRVLESTGSVKGAAAVLRIGVSTMVRWLKRSKRTPHPPQLELADDPLALQQAAAEAAAIAASEVRNEKPAQ